MNQNQINILLSSFFITDKELSARVSFKEFANSLSDIIIDEFANNYLFSNPHLNIYLSYADSDILIKKMKEFLSFIMTAPVDEMYIKKIHFVGSVHYSVKLDPAKVSYGFWALGEILNKMALVNEIVRDNKILMSKLLRFVEHNMNNGFYIEKEKQSISSGAQSSCLNAQNELYIGFNIHKFNMQKIALAVESEDVSIFKDIEEKSSNCAFGKVINELSKDQRHEYILGFDTETIRNIHDSWHKEYVNIKAAIIAKDREKISFYKAKLEELTKSLKNILDKTLKNSLKDGQLSLNSGIRAMKKMTDLFYEKGEQELLLKDFNLSLEDMLKRTILSELGWAVEKIVVKYEPLDDEYSIRKQIRYTTNNIYIGIKLKEGQNSSYLTEMINLLLEVLDLNLTIKEREHSLISFADKAKSANKSKDMFLANMSHELRTPLNAITGFSQILMMKKDTPDSVKKYVDKINIAGNNLLDLVNTILDFAKLEAGKMQFNPGLSNISDIIKEVQTLISPLAMKKDIKLKMPNIISLNLYIDKTLFKQVLINLLTNAVKFTQNGGEISLMVEYDADKHRYIFEVKDNGVGLSKEAIAKLFQAFSQVDNTYQKKQQGTGLGLMISKKIIEELHNGLIWVESEEGRGSSFFVAMPTPMIESHTYIVEEALQNAPRVLIVEDSEEYQKLMVEHLKETHNLTLTDTINRAKELLCEEKFDFVLLDFFLTDGISSEVLQFMEEENIQTPTIVISAEDEINISSSLGNSSNLECIMNKKDIFEICATLTQDAKTSQGK